MRDRSPLLIAACWLLLSPVTQGGDYHDTQTLNCAECHVIHVGAPVPGAGATGSDADARVSRWLAEETPLGVQVERRLLRDDVNELCLSCHDDSSRSTDVLGANRGREPSSIRQAGALNRLGSSGSPASGHTLDALDPAPSAGPSWSPEDENGQGHGLSCINCHQHHGSAGGVRAYRNLRSDAGRNPPGAGLVTYNDVAGVNDLSRDVFVRSSLRYDESAVDFNEPDADDSAMARFCTGCHGGFHGPLGSPAVGGRAQGAGYSAFLRHPAAGVDIGAGGGQWSSSSIFSGHENRVKVMSATGVWDPPGSDVTPTCISCHKAHGNDNPFGLIFRSGRGQLTENGDTRGDSVSHLCGQCHGQASEFAGP